MRFLFCFSVVPAVLKALSYDEMRGTYSVGEWIISITLFNGIFLLRTETINLVICRRRSVSQGATLGMVLVMFAGLLPEPMIQRRSNHTSRAYPGTY